MGVAWPSEEIGVREGGDMGKEDLLQGELLKAVQLLVERLGEASKRKENRRRTKI